MEAKRSVLTRDTTTQAGGLYQVGQQHWGVLSVLGYIGIFLVLVFVMEFWEIAELYWDVLGKFYFDKDKFSI